MLADRSLQDIGQIYAENAAWLDAWLTRRTRCAERAADLTHETFCRLLEKMPDLAPDSPRGYLATIARRLLIDDVRRRDVERAVYEACAMRDAQQNDVTPARILEAIDFLDAVMRALSALPAPVRRSFLLRRAEGLSHSEIAALTGSSTRTVRRHIVEATSRLYLLSADE
jgi:RNA polymerase sigma factor (sigma-70 family)